MGDIGQRLQPVLLDKGDKGCKEASTLWFFSHFCYCSTCKLLNRGMNVISLTNSNVTLAWHRQGV